MKKVSIALVLSLVCLTGYFFYKNTREMPPLTFPLLQTEEQLPENKLDAPLEPSYRNRQFHFSLSHDPLLTVREVNKSGALTVVFQGTAGSEGFQVFAVPYTQTQITEAQFRKDVPSGVRVGAEQILIDEVRAEKFYSRSDIGETVEIWFINKGILYEVTTYKELEPWLVQIMNTWKFLK